MKANVQLFVCCGALLVSLNMGEMKVDMQDMAMDSMTPPSTRPNPDSTMIFVPKNSRLLDADELEKLTASPTLGTVYFYKKDTSEWDKNFLSTYDKSAGFLHAYGLTLGVVDCSGVVPKELVQACSESSQKRVYTYRKGGKVLELEVENMFDVDSIMSNILILVVMDEVPIVQTVAVRQQLEQDSAGHKDMVIAYFGFLGTYESRVFMEIAYAYQDKYKFAITFEVAATTDLQDADLLTESTDNSGFMIWVLYCKEGYDASSGCRSVNYRGLVNLIDLATFFKQLDWPKVVHRSEGSSDRHPCELSEELACVVVAYTPATQDRANNLVNSLQFDLHGMVGLITLQKSFLGKDDPQVIIQKPGGQNVTVSGRLELPMIENLISTHLFPHLVQTQTVNSEEQDDSETVSQIDDMVVQVAYQQRQFVNNVPHVPALNDKTFPSVTRENKLTVVLFYIPFDAQGLVFLHPFQEVGLKLAELQGKEPTAHPLALVNCFDWTDVCQKENITAYPVVYIYRQGGRREQYHHALDQDVLMRTVMLLQANQPLMLKSEEEVKDFLEGRLPSPAYSSVDNLVVLKLSASHKEMAAYKAVIKALETQMLFAIVEPNVKTSFVPDGGVLHKRTKDHHQPMETLTEDLDSASIISFLQKGQFNLFPELTFLNFPALFARKRPFGILFYEPSLLGADDLQQSIISHIMTNKGHDIIFCKMTVGDSNPEARPLLLNYTQSADLPAFTVVNHQKGKVYVLQDKEMKASALFPWIQAVQKGTVVPTKVLDRGEWKPVGQHYDFLARMDRAERMKEKRKADIPEHFPEDSTDQQEQDVETRASLLERQRSRLYHSRDRKMHTATQGHPKENSKADTKMHSASAATKETMTDTVKSKMANMEKRRHPEHSDL